MLEQVKATLMMENLKLTYKEEQLVRDYAEGRLSLEEILSFFQNRAGQDRKAA